MTVEIGNMNSQISRSPESGNDATKQPTADGHGPSLESRDMEPNHLCARCSRALTTSKKLWQPRPAGDPDWTGEKFFHSKNTKQMLTDSVIAASVTAVADHYTNYFVFPAKGYK